MQDAMKPRAGDVEAKLALFWRDAILSEQRSDEALSANMQVASCAGGGVGEGEKGRRGEGEGDKSDEDTPSFLWTPLRAACSQSVWLHRV